MINSTSKNKIFLSSLLLISGMGTQTALATSAYDSTAEITYTISATNRNTNADLSKLSISDSFDTSQFLESGTSSVSVNFDNFSAPGIAYTDSLHVQDSINNSFAQSEYYLPYILTLENTSLDTNDIFDIIIDFSYTLSASVSGENADSDVSISYSNEDFSLDGFDIAYASVAGGINQTVTDSDSFSLTLFSGDFDNIYVDTTISGTLEATVPVPAAFWLLGSAMIALRGIRELK